MTKEVWCTFKVTATIKGLLILNCQYTTNKKETDLVLQNRSVFPPWQC